MDVWDFARNLDVISQPLTCHFCPAVFKFNHLQGYLSKKIPKSQKIFKSPNPLFHNNLSILCVLGVLGGEHFFHLKHASPPNYGKILRPNVVWNKKDVE